MNDQLTYCIDCGRRIDACNCYEEVMGNYLAERELEIKEYLER